MFVYGTPGTAAKFLRLCDGQEKMHPAGQGALNLFESFVDGKYQIIKFEMYSRTPLIRTPKGEEKQFELAEVRVSEVGVEFQVSFQLLIKYREFIILLN